MWYNINSKCKEYNIKILLRPQYHANVPDARSCGSESSTKLGYPSRVKEKKQARAERCVLPGVRTDYFNHNDLPKKQSDEKVGTLD